MLKKCREPSVFGDSNIMFWAEDTQKTVNHKLIELFLNKPAHKYYLNEK